MIKFEFKNPNMTDEHMGIIPYFIDALDKRPAAQQINDAYSHGGGWRVFKGHAMLEDGSLKYPGDPALPVLAEAKLRDETLRFYDYSWFAIVQPDGSFEVARLD